MGKMVVKVSKSVVKLSKITIVGICWLIGKSAHKK